MRQEEDTVREILKESTELEELLATEIEDASLREELDSQLQGMEKYFREMREVGKRIEKGVEEVVVWQMQDIARKEIGGVKKNLKSKRSEEVTQLERRMEREQEEEREKLRAIEERVALLFKKRLLKKNIANTDEGRTLEVLTCQGVESAEKIEGPYSEKVLHYKCNYGMVLEKLKKNEEALKVYQEVIRDSTLSLGANNRFGNRASDLLKKIRL